MLSEFLVQDHQASCYSPIQGRASAFVTSYPEQSANPVHNTLDYEFN